MEHTQQDSTPIRKETQVDTGWRAGEKQATPPVRQETQVDAGWRAREAQAASSARQATQMDAGWRNTGEADAPVANAYARIEDFQTAVGQLPELVSSTGAVYSVKGTLSRTGGESAVLLCAAPDGQDVVAKVYFEQLNSASSSFAARMKVLQYMGTGEGRRYTLAVIGFGLVPLSGSQYYFEITPYCTQGDLTNYRVSSFQEMVALVKYFNEALHSIHSADILHRDIKPANLYRLDGRIVIGDFGVAKLARSGVTRHTAGTDGYRAPESTLAVSAEGSAFFFDKKSDYYSLGVTLGCLYEGHFVYEGMGVDQMTAGVLAGRIPLTRVEPWRGQLENLLNGLCCVGLKQRFGYEEVCRWVADQNYTGGIARDGWPKAFWIMNEEHWDAKSLFEGITRDGAHWNEGKDLLYSKYFENFFTPFHTGLARAAQVADEDWRARDRDKGLSVFLKSLYPYGPIVWRGYTFEGLQALGDRMISTKTPAAYGELLQKKCVTHWLSNTEGIPVEDRKRSMDVVEAMERVSLKEPQLACYWFGSNFAQQRRLEICGCTVADVGGLLRALFQTPRNFYREEVYHKLMSRTGGAGLYGFLYSFGYRQIIEGGWARMEDCSEFDKVCILIGMLDTIAVKAGEDPEPLRRFFVQYGPVGIASYTKRLVERTGSPVYRGLNAGGKQLLTQIADFRPAAAGTVDELLSAYEPLLELVKRLQIELIDNPYCVSAGIYESQGVLCTNLAGCFALRIFGRSAPLGFHGWIESSEGGTAL